MRIGWRLRIRVGRWIGGWGEEKMGGTEGRVMETGFGGVGEWYAAILKEGFGERGRIAL